MKKTNKSTTAEPFSRTDLAIEDFDGLDGTESQREEKYGEIFLSSLHILTDAAAERLKRPRGEYITISFPPFFELSEKDHETLVAVVSRELLRLALKNTEKKDFSVMIVGLGNRQMTPDAVGPLAADGVEATAHLRDLAPEIFNESKMRSVFVISPGVSGQTGIESAELVRSAINAANPDLAIVIDALASLSCHRLGTTVQITDTGISPGAGVGNHRTNFNKESLGIPIIAIGVPTVVNSSVLIEEALLKSGITLKELPNELSTVLEQGRSFFVSGKDCDAVSKRSAEIISAAINRSFGTV